LSFALTLCLVLLAAYALVSLLLSIIMWVAWHAGLERSLATAADLLAMRLLPAGGAVFLVLTAVLPAFLVYEPRHAAEPVSALPVMLALFTLVAVGDGVRRAWRANAAARSLIRHLGPVHGRLVESGHEIDIFDVEEPIVAVVGGWQPRIVAAKRVVAACSAEEFQRVIAHETAHLCGRDNLKLLLLVSVPDILAWMPLGAALASRWRAAAEFAADERATGPDPKKRIALASALVKVARLSSAKDRTMPALSMPVAVDDVEGRVRQLLAPSPNATRTPIFGFFIACALLLPAMTAPFYGLLHELIEALVAFGR